MRGVSIDRDGLAIVLVCLMAGLAIMTPSTVRLPAIAAGGYLALILTPLLDPRRAGEPAFRQGIAAVATVGVGALFALQLFQVAGFFGRQADRQVLVAIFAGAGAIVAGNYLPKLQSNWFFGVRTPWTLTSESSWLRTHRLAGRLLMAGGGIILGTALLRPDLSRTMIVAMLFATAAVSTVYSYFAWRADPQRAQQEESLR